jgi:hypothetical protein
MIYDTKTLTLLKLSMALVNSDSLSISRRKLQFT